MENKIRDIKDLQRDVDTLQSKEELMCRQRTELSQSINSTRKQIERLNVLILDNNQYEIFET